MASGLTMVGANKQFRGSKEELMDFLIFLSWESWIKGHNVFELSDRCLWGHELLSLQFYLLFPHRFLLSWKYLCKVQRVHCWTKEPFYVRTVTVMLVSCFTYCKNQAWQGVSYRLLAALALIVVCFIYIGQIVRDSIANAYARMVMFIPCTIIIQASFDHQKKNKHVSANEAATVTTCLLRITKF